MPKNHFELSESTIDEIRLLEKTKERALKFSEKIEIEKKDLTAIRWGLHSIRGDAAIENNVFVHSTTHYLLSIIKKYIPEEKP